MEWRLEPTGPSRSAHGQVSWGSCFVARCESCVQDVKTVVLVIRVSLCSFWECEKLHCLICIFSLIIVKSLQFRGHRQIAESRKYCLVYVIIFLWRVFSLFFCFSQVKNFVLIPYTDLLKLGFWELSSLSSLVPDCSPI